MYAGSGSESPPLDIAAAVVRHANRGAHVLDRVVAFTCFVLLLSIVVTVCAGVVARYVLNASFTWTEEFGSLAFVWLAFVGVAAGHREGRHVALTLFEAGGATPAAVARRALVNLIVAYTTLWLLSGGIELVETIGGTSTALGWPNALKYVLVPAGCAISLLYIILSSLTLRAMVGSAALVALAAITLSPLQTALAQLMGAASPSLVMTAVFIACLVIGVPIAFSMLFCVFIATLGSNVLPVAAIVHTVVGGASSFVLLAIPFFLAAGYIMNAAGLSARIIDFASALVGHFRGGLAQANVLHSAMLGGICGSSSADAASTTKILVPEMIKRGYSPPFSCAVTAVGSILPNCFPPSLALLIYAAVAEVSVAQLFMAGIVPGLLLTVLMMLTVHWVSLRRSYEPANSRIEGSEVLRTGIRVIPTMLLAVVILGLLRFGVATATEVGAIAIVWVFLLGKVFYRSLSWREAYREFTEGAVESALIGFLIAVSAPFAWVLIAEGMPQILIKWATPYFTEGWQLLLVLNVLMLVAGTVLELVPMILILVPLLVPVLGQFGVDPIHIGIVIVINGLLGSLTPPVGILVFITASIARVQATAIFRECKPFLVACTLGLLLITFVPSLSLKLWQILS
jgi:tripartite ATP-independent transporter DctM subunit